MTKTNPLKRTFDLYTSDLSFDEIERLIKRDASEVYDFFKSEIPKSDSTKNKFVKALIFIRSLFNAFLLKLNAARRIFYLAALLFFLVGYINNMPGDILLAFVIVNLLLAFELADKLTVKDELEVAHKIQKSLIPKTPSKINKYHVASYYEPAREVGGDYFDIINKTNDHNETLLIVGDISGKGMAAALYMVRVQAIIQSLINNFESVKEILINLKNYFSKNLRREYFLTIIAAKVKEDGSINFCRAGHTPLLHYKKKTNSIDILNPKGLGIGFNDKGMFEKTLEEVNIFPESDDILLFYTDGVTESMNEYKFQFGEDRLKKIIQDNADKNVEEIRNRILRAIKNFCGDEPQNDDLTMLILKAG